MSRRHQSRNLFYALFCQSANVICIFFPYPFINCSFRCYYVLMLAIDDYVGKVDFLNFSVILRPFSVCKFKINGADRVL